MELNAAVASGVSAALVLALFVSAYVNRREFARFTALTDTGDRQRAFRKTVIQSFLFFTGVTVVALAVFGRLPALTAMPAEFAPLAERMIAAVDADYIYIVAGVILGFVLITQTLSLHASDSQTTAAADNPALAMLPRNGREMVWTGLVALNAGLSEELFFRLLLPLLLVHALGSPEAAFAATSLLFGVLHYNQGVAAVIVTALVAAAFAAIYLASGNIWLAVAVHAAVDLNALVLQPLIRFAIRPRASGAGTGG